MEVIKIKKTNELNKGRKDLKNIYFSKKELSLILNIYSINVAKGVWKDYALDFNSSPNRAAPTRGDSAHLKPDGLGRL